MENKNNTKVENITNTKIAFLGAFAAGIVGLLLGTVGTMLGTYLHYMSVENQLINVASSSVLVFILMFLWYFVYFRMRKMNALSKWKLVTMTALFFCILAGLQFGLLFILFIIGLMCYVNLYFNRKAGVVTRDERTEHIALLSARRTLEATIILLLIIIITGVEPGNVYIMGLNDFAPLLLGFIVLFYSYSYHYYTRKLQ